MCFCPFSQTYEFAKFWIIKLYLDISDVIHGNEHTKYENCSLHTCGLQTLDFFVDTILFFEEKGWFSCYFEKVATFASLSFNIALM